MGVLSSVGRVLFGSFFLLSAYREYVRPSPLPPECPLLGSEPGLS
jgi:hypothetical protein